MGDLSWLCKGRVYVSMSGLTVYHVTKVQQREEKPEWGSLRPSNLRDQQWDGVLTGLRGVNCGVTLINAEVPKWTPFPVGLSESGKFWRAQTRVDLTKYRVFYMHSHRRGRGIQLIQLLFCNVDDAFEADFALALRTLQFKELFPPSYGGYLPEGQGPNFLGHEWVNCLFLSELSGVAWDLAKKRELVTPGKLIPEDRSNGP